jgi:competence protein ComEC
LFIIAVLSFICGIYCEVLYTFRLNIIFILFLISICFFPVIINKKNRFAAILIFLCFFLIGIIRTGTVTAEKAFLDPGLTEENEIYEGYITDSSKHIKTIRLITPPSLNNIKVAFITNLDLNIGDRIRTCSKIRELSPAFHNPYTISWKWLKKLEGVNYEIKGTVITVLPGGNFIQMLRNKLKKTIENSGAKQQDVIKALTIGDKTSLDENTINIFLKTGTSHILAISGLHVGIITGLFFFMFRWLLGRFRTFRLSGRHTKYASLMTIPFPFIFMVISGSGVSTIRATIMITVFMLSIFFERQREILNTIALSALIILLIYPHSLFMPSFQLSFTSVLFIVIIMGKIYPHIKLNNTYIKWFLTSVLTTVVATIGTLPIVIYHFYGINPICIIHNLISIPSMCMLSIPMSFSGMIFPYGGYLLRLAGELINLNIAALSYLDFGYIFPIIRPNLFEMLLFYAFLLCIIFFKKKLVISFLVFIVIPITIIHIALVCNDRYNNKFSLNFIDVGIGDAILVEAPKGVRMLIDAGGDFRGNFDTGRAIVAPILLSKKILTLDYVISTHPHSDHAGGLPYILNTFRVKTFVAGGYYINDSVFMEIIKIVKNKNINFQMWKQGNKISINSDTQVLVMNPWQDFSGDDLNDASLVLKFIYKNTSFLLTGDIGSEVEEKLILSGMPLSSNIMKIPHHGSKYSSSLPFLYAVKPGMAVLSAGSGIKGLPSEEAIDRYKMLSIPIFRTDRNGFIQICSDGNRITGVKSYWQ